jgi:hypothetical protein
MVHNEILLALIVYTHKISCYTYKKTLIFIGQNAYFCKLFTKIHHKLCVFVTNFPKF